MAAPPNSFSGPLLLPTTPPPSFFLSSFRDPFHKSLLQKQVSLLLHLRVREEVSTPNISLFQRRKGGLRPILDIRRLYKYIYCLRFRMVTLVSIIQAQDRLISLNFQDTYFHIAIQPVFRKYLRFMVRPNHYQYKIWPFILSTALRVFMKCLMVVAVHLRKKGIHSLCI